MAKIGWRGIVVDLDIKPGCLYPHEVRTNQSILNEGRGLVGLSRLGEFLRGLSNAPETFVRSGMDWKRNQPRLELNTHSIWANDAWVEWFKGRVAEERAIEVRRRTREQRELLFRRYCRHYLDGTASKLPEDSLSRYGVIYDYLSGEAENAGEIVEAVLIFAARQERLAKIVHTIARAKDTWLSTEGNVAAVGVLHDGVERVRAEAFYPEKVIEKAVELIEAAEAILDAEINESTT